MGTPAKIDSSIAGTPSGVPGIFDEQVAPVSLPVDPGRRINAVCCVIGQERRQLHRDPTIDSIAGVVCGPEQVRGAAQIFERQFHEQPFSSLPGLRPLVDAVVIRVSVSDRVIENGRVRGQTGDRELVDVPAEPSAVEKRAGDVVEPDDSGQDREAVESFSCFCPPSAPPQH